MSKIYTRRGDRGMTTLADGKAVAKTSELIEFYGCLDELNAFLGWTLEACYGKNELNELSKKICRIQRELFDLIAQLATPNIIRNSNIAVLEQEIDTISNQLPPVNFFILPGGGEVSSRLHIARAICRRAECAVFKLKLPRSKENIAAYLNRLSDWLYVVARYTAFLLKIEEICL